MRINSGSNSTSFYETFSDLIFGTMAIFVLLMMLFVIMIAKEEAADAVETEAFELVIAVDTSGSMDEQLDVLTSAILLVRNIIPELNDSIRIGIVVYQSKIAVYEMQPMLPVSSGAAHALPGQESIDEWMDEWLNKKSDASRINELLPFNVNIGQAVDRALAMFSSPSTTDTDQLFVLVGDIGPWETPPGDYRRIEPGEERDAASIVDRIERWAGQSDRRRVMSVYAPPKSAEPRFPAETRRFFQNVAETSGERGVYTEDWGDLATTLILSVIKHEDDDSLLGN